MATNASKFLCIVLFFAFVAQGYGQYAVEDLTVKQSKTGKIVKNKPEWEAKVVNAGPCTFQNLKLSCVGLKSLVPINGSALTQTGNVCQFVIDLYGESEIGFKYVWAKKFNLKIIDGTIACS